MFCDRLFRAFGHAGYKEAGASLEFRIQKPGSAHTSFADLVWKPRVLVEMKRAGENLSKHYDQAFNYWLNAVPNRPQYVVLCNFKEFWIYDLDRQLYDPVDKVDIDDLTKRYIALNFLFPKNIEPIFDVRRPDKSITRNQAQRFVLQCVVAMFAEDADLLPSGTTISLSRDCLEHGQSSYDLFGGLFRQMDEKTPAPGGRYAGVPYFNGGLFSEIEPVELLEYELGLIGGENGAAMEDWSKVNPSIFGTLFQQSMDKTARHALGAHYTSEAEIQRIVTPTITTPWLVRLERAMSLPELLALRMELLEFKILDPACGSGNFLYIAFRELCRIETQLLHKI